MVVLDVELFLLENMFIQGLEILQLNQPRFPINSLKNLIPVLHIHDLLLQTGNHNGQTKEYILLLPLNLHDELIPEELRDVEIQELKSKCVDELFYQNHYHSSLFGHLDIYDLLKIIRVGKGDVKLGKCKMQQQVGTKQTRNGYLYTGNCYRTRQV